MNKVHCNIIKDILPLYVDDVVSEETRTFIYNHISECFDCKNELELLKKEISDKQMPSEVMKGAEPIMKIKKQIWNGKVKAITIAVIVMVLIFLAVTISKNMTLKSNENNIVATWSDSNENVISFNENGTVNVSKDLKNTGIESGDATYYFSFTDIIRVTQVDDSVEFHIKIKNDQLVLYLAGQEYLKLEKE